MGQKKKKAFLMNEEWGDFIKVLSDEDAGQLLKAIYALNEGETDIEFSNPTNQAFFGMIEKIISENNEKYEEKCRKNRENASKRRSSKDTETSADKPVAEDNQSKANATENKSEEANATDCLQSRGDISSSSSSSSSSSVSVETKEIIDYLNQKTGKSFKSKTKATQSTIKARLAEGFTVEDFKTVIDFKAGQWLNNPDMEQYLRPETLFCAKHFESYLQSAPRAKPMVVVNNVPSPEVEYEEMTDEEFDAAVGSGFGGAIG